MNPPERFEDLLGREIAGSILPTERAELEAMVRSQPALAEERRQQLAMAAALREALTPPALDASSLRPEEPPGWIRSELESAAGMEPWAAVRAGAERARGRASGTPWWQSAFMRWAAVAVVVVLVATPVILDLKNREEPGTGGLRGWQSDAEGGAVLLAPVNETAFAQPAFIWLPAPGNIGPAKFSLLSGGRIIWEKEGARSPLKLSDLPDAPTMKPGVAYEWRVQPDSATEASSAGFRLAGNAAGSPGIAATAAEAVSAARAAEAAGRPHDGIMLLASLPVDLRAEPEVRALRVELMQKTGKAPSVPKP